MPISFDTLITCSVDIVDETDGMEKSAGSKLTPETEVTSTITSATDTL